LKSDFTFAGKDILVVDDQKPFQIMIRGMLNSLEAEDVVVASSGEAAIQKCNKTKFDIIFIDYNLGAGRNGRQLLEELKSRNLLKTSCVSILVTGESLSTMVIGMLEAQPDDYIVKPFSQSLLLQRVSKAWKRRQAFLDYYQQFERQNLEAALEELTLVSAKYPRYTSFADKYQAEVLYQLERFDDLQSLIDEKLGNRRVHWPLIYQAKIYQKQNKYYEAIKSAKEAILNNKLNMEAYDLIADSYLELDDLEQSYNWIRAGIEKSPFSVSRQYRLSSIAKLNQDFETSIKACNQVVDLTSYSFKKDYQHVLNHIRNIIDICELEEDEKKKRRYNQEVIYALQKTKRDNTNVPDFTQEDFETLCLARLDSVNGMTYRAKQSFAELSTKYRSEQDGFPLELLADSVLLLLKIGDFDKAIEFSKVLANSDVELDEFTQSMIQQAKMRAEEAINNVRLLNKKGIEEFKAGHLDEAEALFEQSLKVAPMNTGSAINLVQVLIEKIAQSKKQRHPLIEKCGNAFKILDGMPLAEVYQKRASELKAKFQEFKAEK
jgi:CheY-like chemotaxis protein/Flp pilus assembly protein TadD